MFVCVFLFVLGCSAVTSQGVGLIGDKDVLPWHALVYSKSDTPYRYICGGTIVKPAVVISVAHCFWSETDGKLQPASQYAVAAGKMYRPWDMAADSYFSQKSDVVSINIPSQFRGAVLSYSDDISVVVLAKSFVYNIRVQPAYLDFDETFDRSQISKERMAKLPTWNVTSPVLKVAVLSPIPFDKCGAQVPLNFKQFITGDKICAGSDSSAPCVGDSGAGLVIPENERGETHYYLRGVLSSAAPTNTDSCSNISLFTHIINHEKFVKNYLVDTQL